MMECKKNQDQFSMYLENCLSEVETSEIEEHLKSCVNCQNALEETIQFSSILEASKEELPSNRLRENFEKMLAKEKQNQQVKVVPIKTNNNWKTHVRVAASIAIIVSAFLIGKYQSNISAVAITEHQENKNEVLGLLKNESASKRILAINNSKGYTKKDTKIIEALIDRLYFDENTNVRIVAAEVLSKFSSEEIVKAALIKALETEKKASVQIELIQILGRIQEKRALKPMQKLLNEKEIPNYVRQELQNNIPNLL